LSIFYTYSKQKFWQGPTALRIRLTEQDLQETVYYDDFIAQQDQAPGQDLEWYAFFRINGQSGINPLSK